MKFYQHCFQPQVSRFIFDEKREQVREAENGGVDETEFAAQSRGQLTTLELSNLAQLSTMELASDKRGLEGIKEVIQQDYDGQSERILQALDKIAPQLERPFRLSECFVVRTEKTVRGMLVLLKHPIDTTTKSLLLDVKYGHVIPWQNIDRWERPYPEIQQEQARLLTDVEGIVPPEVLKKQLRDIEIFWNLVRYPEKVQHLSLGTYVGSQTKENGDGEKETMFLFKGEPGRSGKTAYSGAIVNEALKFGDSQPIFPLPNDVSESILWKEAWKKREEYRPIELNLPSTSGRG